MHLSGSLEARQQGQSGGAPGTQPTNSLQLSITSSPAASPTSSSSSLPPTATDTLDLGPGIGETNTAVLISVMAVLGAVCALTIGFILLRKMRLKHKNPKYVPTPFLKNAWQRWNPSIRPYSTGATESLEPISRNGSNQASATVHAATGAVVDRAASVRSVMTLPAYRANALTNERVLGREGERGGIDVVVEFPEAPEEEEERREEEMEALYQVRLARRRENEEREERRRLRREARERGDYVALRAMAASARAAHGASAGQTVEELRAEHERIKKERQKPVAAVAYGDLGVARHDGTRIRANSVDSEHQGLLGDAASIATTSRHHHRRERSTSSILSIDTQNSDLPSPRIPSPRIITRSRGNSNVSHQTNRRPSTSPEGRAGSSPEMINQENVPPNSPPRYENTSSAILRDENSHPPHEPPPDYQSPIRGRGELPRNDSPLPPSPIRGRGEIPSNDSALPPMSPVSPLCPDFRLSSIAISVDGDGEPQSPAGHLASENRPSSTSATQLPYLSPLPTIHVDPASPSIGSTDDVSPRR
ncbi:uncharacterized protein L3040_005172 [Drepanopeziza brunnea f. sp. 'multigermtubi']|uniref:Uncharacterized protein n=1 Tax=Marssonina brunnea f. sp. multigermtubi (strain MB_m1) TaxID=1072389 RepID=K1XJJ5_MARBU|nr:uncharacterized protein MBM_09148 [Drepanopeziza brunnea f. sp. 'multigermtubi' MB_m1]EKD12579.1 hypothetical protein MBM_09148 [Drepanopeziza brunnea f. sp. 'multigermtubi' MB_m1]KAJ5041592.1 hypothetical protein L3040_005172 [Drepanopeziza brunnea f. sp. 'multigermtubi']